jgi:hypothetical protein
MPKMHGGTACRHIIARDPAARIVLVSAWSPLDGADKSGAISFLPKPVDFDRLNATLQSIAETLPLPWPAEMPIPDLYYQPDTFQAFTFTPTPSSDLPAPNFEPVAEPSPVAPPFSETSVPADALQNFPEPTAELCALKQKKSKTQRSTPNRRHVR